MLIALTNCEWRSKFYLIASKPGRRVAYNTRLSDYLHLNEVWHSWLINTNKKRNAAEETTTVTTDEKKKKTATKRKQEPIKVRFKLRCVCFTSAQS